MANLFGKYMAGIVKELSYRRILNIFGAVVLLVILHNIAIRDYLLFHVLVEIFSIIVAFALFIITWNSKNILDNSYLIIIGIAAFFIGLLDLFHALSYKGMNFLFDSANYASEFWIAARFFTAVIFLTGFYFLNSKIRLSYELLFLIYSVVTILIILSILYWKIFPVCYVENFGQTRFKIVSEYVIILVFLLTIYFLLKNRHNFYKDVYYFLLLTLIFSVAAELCFSLYFSVYGLFNQLGHYFKLAAYFMLYKAIVETAFLKPNEIIYRNLAKSREKINQINKQLQDQINTRDKLFSVIAHDLRSPFTALIWYAELLYKEGDKLTPEKIREYNEVILKIANNTISLLENLLDWARLKSGTTQTFFTHLNIQEVIRETAAMYSWIARNKNIALQTDIDKDADWVYADREMVKTILRNLISNALKFTHKGGTVTLMASGFNGHIKITVKDTGIGIDTLEMNKLFTEDNSHTTRGTDNEKGSGLGLHLCMEFVEKNNGKIWVESEKGTGTSFIFTLPKATGTPAE